jgi:3-oxoadipate enol-lactonase / 4-carboxymuconolactone decarboxylase
LPFVTVDGTRLYYRLEGRDDRPALILSHSLGVDHGQWDPQAPDLLRHFRVLRHDFRGHGASDAPPGEYTIEQLARDVLAVADAAGHDRFAFCGLSLGGMIGQWLAANAGDRLTHLVLANTSPRMDAARMEDRRTSVLAGGMGTVADAVLGRFFTPESLAANSPYVAATRRAVLATDPTGYAGCCAAIRDMDQTAALGRIWTPTLIIAGTGDLSTPWNGHGDALAASIINARVVRLRTAHLSNIERPRSFTAALLDFLLPHDEADPLSAGWAMRRAMLGDAHVDRVMAGTTAFNRDFQEIVTRYAWGDVWTRPVLDARTRRLLALATLASGGRWDEFRLHLRAGLEHELEPCDLEEMLLETAVYAGVPAANTGFHIAMEELGTTGA